MGISKDLIDGVELIVDNAINNAPFVKIRNGVVVKVNGNDNYTVKIDSKEYSLSIYIPRNLVVNQIIKVVIPDNNMTSAFIL